MKKLNINILSLITVLLCASQLSFGQANNVRGMYVKDIDNWLGNATSENALLTYAQGNAYTYILFYDLGSLNFSSSTTKNALASFISRAKTQYGLLEIGACGENSSFFSNNIIPYNNGRSSSSEKFDILNLEFEFWVSSSIAGQYCSRYLVPNGFSCDTAGAYKFAKREMIAINSIAHANGLISEMYLGWPTKGQLQDVANGVDRVLLHAYRPDDSDVYQYSRNRLIDIASVGHPVKIIPIFSAESAFMGPWLATHAITRPYQTYSSYYTAETGSWKQNINLQGYHWFTYSELPKTISATATISASGATTFCTGGNVTLTANSGASYLWAPGGQVTKSIVVTQSGNYTVTVVSTTGVSITSAAVNVSVGNTTTAPTVTASGPTTFCASSSVTLTSSTAGSYLWSSGQTTQSISVNQSGSYSVTITSGTCSATSSSTTVNATSAPATPTVTTSGPLSTCTGNSITLTSSTANGYLWSTGSTSSSITVNTAGTYWVRVFSSGNCYNQSVDVVISAATPPSTPTVTASGSLNLCPGENVVLSTPFNSSGYLWSNGATTQTIIASSAGTYWVKIFNSSNCSAQSSNTVITMSSGSTPVISASGSLNLCTGNSVTLTSSSAGNYTWSNGETTQSITVSAAGTFWVRTGAGACNVQSSNVVVTTNGAAVPIVTANGPLDFCQGSSVTLTSTTAGGYLWSTGETTQSITVSNSANYWVRGYVSGNCYAQSVNHSVVAHSIPTTPIVSAGGSLILTTSNPSVTLTSSSAASYLWNTGATTQSITVSTAGSYVVVATSSSGWCTATSTATVVTSVACTPPAIPLVSLSGSSVLQPGQSVVLTSDPASGYLWSSGETTQSIIVTVAGTYSVQAYSAPNCYSISQPVTITYATTDIGNIESVSTISSFTVFPNPATNQISFKFISENREQTDFILFDITGRELDRQNIHTHIGENQIDMNVGDYTRGVYFGSLISKNEKQTIRLILN